MILLREAAAALRVHPRTVLRHVTGESNPYWAPGYEDEAQVDEGAVALGLDMDPRLLLRVLRGRDKLFSQQEAADHVKVPVRTFRYRGYPAAVRKRGLVRYSELQIARFNAENFAQQ